MRLCDLETDAAHIRDAFDELQLAWQDVAASWNDAVSRAYCDQYLEPLGPVVKTSLDAIARTSLVVDQMRLDCEN